MSSASLDRHEPAYRDDFAYALDNRIIQDWYADRIVAACHPAVRCLELGIGHGRTTDRFSRAFATHEVVEGSAAIIRSFRQNHPDCGAVIHHALFEAFRPEHALDVLILGFVLEHVEDPVALLRRYRPFLAETGRCFIAVPNGASLHRRIGQAAGLLDDLSALGPGDRALGHLRQYTVDGLDAELDAAGFSVVRREGIFLKPVSTAQLRTLALDDAILRAMCEVAVPYPELSCALLFEAVPKGASRPAGAA